MMARVEWIKLGNRSCEYVGETVELLEKRAYPDGILDESGDSYRVLARKCSAGYECGGMDDPCQWAEVGHDGRKYNR